MTANTQKVIAIQNKETGVITAFLHDIPAIVVQGKTKDDVERKLDALMVSLVKRINNMRENLVVEPVVR